MQPESKFMTYLNTTLSIVAITVSAWNAYIIWHSEKFDQAAIQYSSSIDRNGTLLLISTNPSERTPDEIRLTPRFVSKTDVQDFKEGEELFVTIPQKTHKNDGTVLAFDNIVDTICDYPKNNCSNYFVKEIVVRYIVDGRSDADSVLVPRS